MSLAPDKDIGPLIWVKGEIDASFGRAGEALSQFADSKDSAQIKIAVSHLHQAQGALAIVGLEGLTLFSQAMENLVAECERGEIEASPFNLALAQRALTTIRAYLDNLVDGQADQPLRLWPMFSELQKARGIEAASPADLFFPDLSLRPPKRPSDFIAPSEEKAAQLLRNARAQYQKGLLQFLKDGRSGADDMFNAVKAVESCQTTPASRAFWWAAMGLMDTIANEPGVATPEVKKLCGRVDQQLRRLLAGYTNVSERLMRDVLFKVAMSATGSELAERVRDSFNLGSILPDRESTKPEGSAILPMLRELRDQVGGAKEEWEQFCAGTAVALPRFDNQTKGLEAETRRLGVPILMELAEAIHQIAAWLHKEPLKFHEGLGMEVATTLLLMENAVDNFDRLDTDFQPQANMMSNRLKAVQQGRELGPLEAPLLDKMSRQAQERMLMRQVVKEIQSNLNQIEQVLDNFFRNPLARKELQALATPVKQVEGALFILDQSRAAAILKDCARRIETFVAGQGSQQDYDEVAEKLSALGFFVAALPYGNADIHALENPGSAPEEDVDEDEGFVSTVFFNSVEDQLERQKQKAKELASALKAAPQDGQLLEKLQQNLEAIRQDANLAGDTRLEKQVGETLAKLETVPTAELTLEPALAPARPEAPAPSAEVARLAASDEGEIDAELLEIFLEEAGEVLDNVAQGLVASRVAPHDHGQLTVIRRGFHTLKGSGRMVNLKELGEVAWSVEQVMNRWLQQELDATPDLHEFIAAAHTLFFKWIGQLRAGGATGMDAHTLLAAAEALKAGESPLKAPLETPQAHPPALEPNLPASPAGAALPVQELEAAPAPLERPFVAAIPAFPDLELPSLELKPDAEPLAAEVATPTFHVEPALQAEVQGGSPFGDGEALPSLDAIMDKFAQEPHVESIELVDLDLEPEPEALLEPVEEEIMLLDGLEEVSSADLGLPSVQEAVPALIQAAPAPDTVIIGQVSLSRGLYESYMDEVMGHISVLRRELDDARQAPYLPPTEAGFRAAHTLAGISGTVGILPLHHLAKGLEHALERLAHADAPVGDNLPLLEEGTAAVARMVSDVASLQFPEPAEELRQRLDSLHPTSAYREHGGALVPDIPMLTSPEPEAPVLSPPIPVFPVQHSAEPVAEPMSGLPSDLPSVPPGGLEDDLDEQLLPIFLEESVDLMRDIESATQAWISNPQDTGPSQALARHLHTLKGSARMAGAMNLGEAVHDLETRADEAVGRNTVSPVFFEELRGALDRISQSLDGLRSGGSPAPLVDVAAVTPNAQTLAAPQAASGPELQEGAGQQAQLRVRADLVDRLVNEAGEMSIARARIEGEMRTLHASLLDLTENVIRLRRQLREIEIQAESQMQSREARAQSTELEFDPLEFDRFTRFQELTRMMAESVNDVSTVQHNLLKNLEEADAALVSQGRINRNLAQSLMSVRMVPFNSLAPRLHRTVRQTAKELGRKVNLDIRGGQVDLDRSVLERMSAPIEHLLRNAINHGIELPNERVAVGKAELGQITLNLSQEGNEVLIRFSDDGKGLDFDGIRHRAIQNGLLSADASVDDKALTDFIFQTGFSTATELTEVAGRGVGMDVVKSETAALGGRIEVSSEAGQGCTFGIYLPLTLAVAQTLLVEAEGRIYALPSSMVQQAREVKPAQIAQIRADQGVEWLGARYPYHTLSHLLGGVAQSAPNDANSWLLLLRSGNQQIALHVDALQGNQEIVVKNIGPQLARVPGLTGATVLGDGKVVLILNPVLLAGRDPSQHQRRSGPREAPAAVRSSHVPRVMVVDDSLTVRKITSRLLEREGYQVLLAKDGVDALEALLETVPDVMLVDIEMPRMDGFDLTRNIRGDARLKGVPIIMITSRTADKHRNYAMEIGVNHYLGKPYREDELLGLIKDHVH